MWKEIRRRHYTDTSVFWSDFKDFIENQLGWAVYDDQDSESNYKVYTTVGENGDRDKEPFYFKVSWESTKLHFRAYRYWDSTNHTGAGEIFFYNTYNNWYDHVDLSNDMYVWLWGNKDVVFVLTKRGSTYHTMAMGYTEKRFRSVHTVLTADATAGDNVQIEVESTEGFYPRKYRTFDIGSGNLATVNVISVDDATHLTIENLPYNLKAGSPIGEQATSSFLLSDRDGSYPHVSIGDDIYNTGTNATNNYRDAYFDDNTRSNDDIRISDYLTGMYYSLPVFIKKADHNKEWYGYFETYIRNAGSKSSSVETIYTFSKEDSGATTQDNTGNTLVDSSKSWTQDQWAGKFLVITSGEGKGEYHKIASNDATSLTLEDNWIVNPVNGTAYEIVDEVWFKATKTWALILKEA